MLVTTRGPEILNTLGKWNTVTSKEKGGGGRKEISQLEKLRKPQTTEVLNTLDASSEI